MLGIIARIPNNPQSADALYEPRVALAYYVHFMSQYHDAFGVTTVPKTLGGASANAFVQGLGGQKSAAYYCLFGLGLQALAAVNLLLARFHQIDVIV